MANDVWVLENASALAGTPNWVQLLPTGAPPIARWLHTAVYDPANNRMIALGGQDGAGNQNNEVWVLEHANGLGGTPNWVRLFPTGVPPTPRDAHTAVYDQANNRMIAFAGQFPLFNDVRVLEHANGLGGTPNWVQLFPTGAPPSARGAHTAVYDPNSNSMTVFGGATAGGSVNDVWVLEHANGLGGTPNWIQLFPTGGPPTQRAEHTAVYNPASNRMTIFAGRNGCAPPPNPFNDTWVLTDANGIVTVPIDIKPGLFPNSINPNSKGKIPVAILTTSTAQGESLDFDATTVDSTTVLFGASGTEAAPVHAALEDVDGDGDIDMILHFNTQATGIQCGDTSASLTGETFGGQEVAGSDSVKTAGCK